MKKPIYILGTATSHDGSACLLKDGKIAFAIEKERITRIKHDGGNDSAAINYLLDAEGITINDIDLIVQSNQVGDLDFIYSQKLGNQRLFSESSSDNVNQKIVSISHHLAHAYSAIGTCPFTDFNVLVLDGAGDPYGQCIDKSGLIFEFEKIEEIPNLFCEKDSFYLYNNGICQTIAKDFSEIHYPLQVNTTKHSIGGVYESISVYCFGGMSDPGKLMGLAPYGKFGKFNNEVFRCENGRVFVNYDSLNSLDKPYEGYNNFKNNFQYYADIAYGIQKELERAVIYIINERYKLNPSENLCYAGGVALNAVANARILKETPYKNVYIQPAAADNGLAFGCAYYGWLEYLKKPKIIHNGNTCFGKKYSDQEIEHSINTYGNEYDLKELAQVIDGFFIKLPRQKNISHKYNSIIQFEISNVGIYQLIAKDDIKVEKGIFGLPTCIIKAEANNFYQFILNPKYFNQFIESGKIEVSNQRELATIMQNYNIDVNNILNGKSIVDISKEIPHLKSNLINYKKSNNVAVDTAKLLSDGNVIGWFQDGSEFGPRSLGRRSILADPRNSEVRDFINARIKFREDFRPFAPSVLKEDADVYFKMEGVESPYMIMVFDIKEEWKGEIKSVVHENNTCRVQTVTPDWNKKYYDLLTEFKKETGISILLNTSFNRRGMPIVETPKDAIDFFFECELDYLVLGDYIISKK